LNNIDVANQYFDAWNNHDSNAIVATFADGGTYSDPASGGELTGPAIGGYASGLFAGFPDLTFDIVSVASTGEDSVSAQWVMKGTNSGDFAGWSRLHHNRGWKNEVGSGILRPENPG